MAFSIRNLKIRQQVQLVTLAPLFALLCAIAVLFYAYWMAGLSDRAVRRAEGSVAGSEQLLRQITDMHTSVRGYLILHDRALLSAYDQESPAVQDQLTQLRNLESDSPAQVEAIDKLREEISKWQTEWARPTINRVRRGDEIDVAATVADGSSGRGIEVQLGSAGGGPSQLSCLPQVAPQVADAEAGGEVITARTKGRRRHGSPFVAAALGTPVARQARGDSALGIRLASRAMGSRPRPRGRMLGAIGICPPRLC